jgi:hypothetical protein
MIYSDRCFHDIVSSSSWTLSKAAGVIAACKAARQGRHNQKDDGVYLLIVSTGRCEFSSVENWV